MIRKFRIAASVFFGLLTVAIVLLWWRSFWTSDEIHLGVSMQRTYIVSSFQGVVQTEHHYGWSPFATSIRSRPAAEATPWEPIPGDLVAMPRWQFGTIIPTIPHWCLAAATGVTAAACASHGKFGYRFSLRTMLLATTVVAVVSMLCGELLR